MLLNLSKQQLLVAYVPDCSPILEDNNTSLEELISRLTGNLRRSSDKQMLVTFIAILFPLTSFSYLVPRISWAYRAVPFPLGSGPAMEADFLCSSS